MLNLKIQSYGLKQLQKQLRRMSLEGRKEFSVFLEKVADTALEKARQLAPVKTGLYRKSIKKQLLSNIKARIFSERPTYKKGSKEMQSKGHGCIGGLLEYGTSKMREQPHIQPAIEYALRVHHKELALFLHGIFAKYLHNYGE